MSQPPRELLADLCTALDAGTVPSPAVRAWFRAAVRAYERSLPLEQALGLSGPGARRARDAALREAAAHLAPDATPRAAARVLAKHVEHFEARVLPIQRLHPNKPLHGWKLALHRAFETGCCIPRTERQLSEILNGKFPAHSAKLQGITTEQGDRDAAV